MTVLDILRDAEKHVYAADVTLGKDPNFVMSEAMAQQLATDAPGLVFPNGQLATLLGCPVLDLSTIVVVDDEGNVRSLTEILRNLTAIIERRGA